MTQIHQYIGNSGNGQTPRAKTPKAESVDLQTNCVQTPLRVLLVSCGTGSMEINEPLGIECLSAHLKNEFGNRIEIESAFGFIPNDAYDAVCISSCSDDDEIYRIYRRFESVAKLITVGGAFATLYPREILKRCPKAVCTIGEGEISTNSAVRALIEGGISPDALAAIPNLVFLNGSEAIETGRETLNLADIRRTPDHRFCLSIMNNSGLVRMETGRGCDWNKCTFCIMPHKYNGAKCRHYPMERTVRELTDISSKCASTVCLTDEEFIGEDRSHAESFVRAVRELKDGGQIEKSLTFMASVSVRQIKGRSEEDFDRSKKLLREMKDVGFNALFLGIESGSLTQLRRYGKGVSPRDNEDVLNFLKEIGIDADIGFIMFDPLMTFEELEENIDFAVRNGLHTSSSRIVKEMIVIPGTAYGEEVSKISGFPAGRRYMEGDRSIYRDGRVRAVLEQMDIDSMSSKESYAIQSAMRGGNCGSDDRKRLSENRSKEMVALCVAVDRVKAGTTGGQGGDAECA